jgi:hypothetical protein
MTEYCYAECHFFWVLSATYKPFIHSVIVLCATYAECHLQPLYAECHCTECLYGECHIQALSCWVSCFAPFMLSVTYKPLTYSVIVLCAIYAECHIQTLSCWVSLCFAPFMLSVTYKPLTYSVIVLCAIYAECHIQSLYAERHIQSLYAECHCTECHGAYQRAPCWTYLSFLANPNPPLKQK